MNVHDFVCHDLEDDLCTLAYDFTDDNMRHFSVAINSVKCYSI